MGQIILLYHSLTVTLLTERIRSPCRLRYPRQWPGLPCYGLFCLCQRCCGLKFCSASRGVPWVRLGYTAAATALNVDRWLWQ